MNKGINHYNLKCVEMDQQKLQLYLILIKKYAKNLIPTEKASPGQCYSQKKLSIYFRNPCNSKMVVLVTVVVVVFFSKIYMATCT